MRSPSSDHPPAVPLDLKPAGPGIIALWMNSVLCKRGLGSGPHPEIIVKIFRYWHGLRISGSLVFREPDIYGAEFSDPLVADKFTGLKKIRRGALLGSDLKYPGVFAHSPNQFLAFGYGIGQGLFKIDVLARTGRCHSMERMPVVRSHYQHSVNILSMKKSTEIMISLTCFVSSFPKLCGIKFIHKPLGVLSAVGIHITHSHDPRSDFQSAVYEFLHISLPLAARSHASHGQCVAWG